MSSHDRFHNKVVIVTGAASGMGLQIATQFVEEGAHVAMIDFNEDRLSECCIKISQSS